MRGMSLQWIALVVLSAGCASTPPSTPPREPATLFNTWMLGPGSRAEVNLFLDADARLVASFATDGMPVSWNVHTHPEAGVMVVQSDGSGASGRIEFEPPAPGLYSLLWTNENEGELLEVTGRVSGSGGVVRILSMTSGPGRPPE